MNRKLLSVFLLISILLTASCGSSPSGPVSGDDTSATTTDTAESETTAARIEPVLPDTRWDGYKFRVLTKGDTSGHWKSRDIAAAEENGDVINDAVYARNMKVYERFGVEMVDIPSPNGTWDLTSPLRKSVMASSDDYDMVAAGYNDVIVNLSPVGMLMELHNVPYMDLSKPWYDQNANAQTSLDGKLFATAGEMLIMDNEATYGVLFNKKLAEDYGFENFYDKVKDSTWTIDYMTECSRAVAKDLDGDGVMGEKDQWGCIGESFNTYAYMVGCGVQAYEKNKDDIPVFTVNSERFHDSFIKAFQLNRDDKSTMFSENFKAADVFTEVIDPAFSEGRVMFNVAGLVRVTVFRAMETDFGILPMPKFDKEQKEYFSIVSTGAANTISIPVTADAERSGAVIEALSAESHYILTPAFYDTVLKTKAARDDDSADMLDIIFANRIFDVAYIYDWGGLIGSINNLKNADKISSTVESKLKSAETSLEKTITAYKELE